MEIKKFDYEKFIKKSKSLNRDSYVENIENDASISIGATGLHDATVAKGLDDATGATGAIGATGATGIYDDNNTILKHDKTKIVPKEVIKPVTEESNKKPINKALMIASVVIGVCAIGLIGYYFLKKGREENRKRKRILLINS